MVVVVIIGGISDILDFLVSRLILVVIPFTKIILILIFF